MNGVVSGINQICTDLQPVAVAVLILMLVILGLTTIVGGSEAHMKFKETIKWILIGSAVAFGATALGTMISGWFM